MVVISTSKWNDIVGSLEVYPAGNFSILVCKGGIPIASRVCALKQVVGQFNGEGMIHLLITRSIVFLVVDSTSECVSSCIQR